MLKKTVICWFNNLFSSNGFSDFGYLGDLRKYHLTDLQSRLKGRWKDEITVFDSYKLVNWSNSTTSYTVYYTLNGEFIQIKEEVWKAENEVCIRPLRSDYKFS
jgi:hypothetical protein